MKSITAIALSFCLAGLSLAQEKIAELKTLDGKIYSQSVIRKIEPDGISITHDSGTAKVKFSNLSEDLQKRFKYNPDKASSYEQEQNKKNEDALNSIIVTPSQSSPQKAPDAQSNPVINDNKIPGSVEDSDTTSKSVVRLKASVTKQGNTQNAKVVTVLIENASPKIDFLHVEILWIANYESNKSELRIAHRKTEQITLPKDGRQSIDFKLGIITGAYKGYVIRVYDEKYRLVTKMASREPYMVFAEK